MGRPRLLIASVCLMFVPFAIPGAGVAAEEGSSDFLELLQEADAEPVAPPPAACMDPTLLAGNEREFHEFMQAVQEAHAPAPDERGRLEICFANVDTTFFRFDEKTRDSSIFFSRSSFERMLGEQEESTGFIGAMWVLAHELGHHSLVTEEHQEVIQEDLAFGAADLLYELNQSDPSLLRGLYTTLRADEFSDEAFADCFGAALLATSVHDAGGDLMPGERSDLLSQVTQMAPSIPDPGRNHGSKTERHSYVQYGLSIADVYDDEIDPLMDSQIFLCAYRALEAGHKKAAGAPAAMPAFDPSIGY